MTVVPTAEQSIATLMDFKIKFLSKMQHARLRSEQDAAREENPKECT